jgi:drug/metabolite transporter (DMT)-like permease
MIQAISAALLFGASAPLAKLLLGEIDPIPMASFLYLGSGIGLLLYLFIMRLQKSHTDVEAKIDRNEIKWLIGAVLSGGVLAPIVLMFSLRNTPASTASLLLNFESVATTFIAFIAFKESIGKKIWMAVALITSASILLSWDFKGEWGLSLGASGVLLACTLWGIDNNLTRNISAKDPFITVTIKGIGAGLFSMFLAILTRSHFPSFTVMLGAMLLGFLSYGLSIVLFILAMRNLGASRTSAFFGTAPFVGTLLSFLLFREVPNVLFYLALPIMIVGTILILKENHEHNHLHQHFAHEHRHIHDEHHRHSHEGLEDLDVEDLEEVLEHSHFHVHEEFEHSHSHTPDIHHRHVH